MEKTGKQLLTKTEYERLTETLCDNQCLLDWEELDFAILRRGEAMYRWESPSAASLEEAVSMARRAASEMAPEPGREVLAAVIHITAEMQWSLGEIEDILTPVQDSLCLENPGVDVRFSCHFSDGEAHFTLYTAEGKKGTRKADPKPLRSAEEMDERELIDTAMEMAFEIGYLTAAMLMYRFRWGGWQGV